MGIGAKQDDLSLLISKKFILEIKEIGIIVIKHWKINNYIQKDRYSPSKYKKDLKMLEFDDNNAYVFNKDFQGAMGATRDFTTLRNKVTTIEEFKDVMVEIFKNKTANVSVEEDDSLEVDMESEGKFVTLEFVPEK